jgi:hypothetical protein
MATLLDQRPQQASGDDISSNYPPSQQPRVRALEQRAAYDAAKLKQDAEAAARQAQMDITKAQNDDIRLGLDLSRERRAQNAESLDLKKSAAEIALKERDDAREQRSLEEVPKLIAELEASRTPSGYIPRSKMTAAKLKYGFAALSKNPQIIKLWDDEQNLTDKLSAAENESAKWIEDQNKIVLENQTAGELSERIGLKPTGISSSGKIVFGDAKEANQGTRTVVTKDLTGMKTVTEKRPLGAPVQAPAATPAAPTASTTPTADPLAGIVSSGGKIKKVGDKYNAFDKDGKYLGTYSVGK